MTTRASVPRLLAAAATLGALALSGCGAGDPAAEETSPAPSASAGQTTAEAEPTPDDEGYRAGHEDEKAFRARQNVVMELGMMLTLLGRKNVAILMKQQDNMERPSDIQGLLYIPFKDNLQKDAGPLLAKEMAAQGYPISLANL